MLRKCKKPKVSVNEQLEQLKLYYVVERQKIKCDELSRDLKLLLMLFKNKQV